MRKTTVFIAFLLTAAAVFGQTKKRPISEDPGYALMHTDTVHSFYNYDKRYHGYRDSAIFKAGDLGSAAAIIRAANYSKFEWGQTDTPVINRVYSYVILNRVPENSRLNAGASRGKYVIDQANLFNGEFSIELDPKTLQFKRINIAGDSTKVMETVGRCAFLGSEVEMTARLYPGKKKVVYVGRKKYLITVKQIK